MNPTQLGLVSSIFTLGGLIGALSAGPVAARCGRLLTMRLTTTFVVLGPVGEALAPNIGVMAAGRFVSGLGAGAALVVVPIYISEISPPRQRGFFGAFTQIMTNTGIFVTQLLGYFLSHGQMWRVILAVAGAIGLVQLAGLTVAIDSPKWEADQGKVVQAKINLRRIRGGAVDIQKEVEGWGIESEYGVQGALLAAQVSKILCLSLAEEEQTLLTSEDHASHHSEVPTQRKTTRKDILSIFEVLWKPEYNRAIIAVIAVMIAQQLCGKSLSKSSALPEPCPERLAPLR
jgi:MFS family permease